MINEAAVKWLGWEDAPLNKRIRLGNFKDGQVIGVMKDFHVRSLHSGIEPMMLQLAPGPDPYHYLAVRIAPDDVAGTMGFLEGNWREIYPDDSFTYSFLDDDFDSLYQNEARQGRIFRSFSLLAVFIACLGLLGLASFTAEQRTREIGVRKVLGATASGIVALVSKEYINQTGRVRQPDRLACGLLRYERLARQLRLQYGPFTLGIRARRSACHSRYHADGKLQGHQRRPRRSRGRVATRMSRRRRAWISGLTTSP